LDLGVITPPIFFLLVMMALVTTYMTAPLLSRSLRHTALAERFESAFAVQAEAPSIG
jgi:hypothetical protein